MQAFDDIFAIWEGGWAGLAAALDEKEDTVYRWFKRRRIPDSAWAGMIEAAKVRGKVLTVADLHAANKPRKPRSGARHKIRSARKRRAESRVAV